MRLWRRGQGWTQQLAAEAFGVSTRTWIRYEQNSPPRIVDLAILALSLLELKCPINTMTEQEKNTQLLRVNRLVSEITRIGQVPKEHISTSKIGQTRSF
ncbi:helix-turn-helix transcriptional regulator [Providencia stuartii]|uniref:helix-turn-helix transcriptional regulator n=1 Tax=Providencia stuartii TaxID=588 RepID=UPI001C5CA520